MKTKGTEIARQQPAEAPQALLAVERLHGVLTIAPVHNHTPSCQFIGSAS